MPSAAIGIVLYPYVLSGSNRLFGVLLDEQKPPLAS